MFPRHAAIGITTTVPVEIILAAGLTPVDVNNIFVTAPDAYNLVSEAEAAGFPRTVCAWIKGIYATLRRSPHIAALVVVTQGDCSNTHVLMELLQAEGRLTIPFQFPYPRDRELLRREVELLMTRLGTDWPAVRRQQTALMPLRRDLAELDRLTWETGQVQGRENFQFLIASSDFNGNPETFAAALRAFLQEAGRRSPRRPRVRLGLIGIPPILADLFPCLEELDAEVVYNEIPRQFSMPPGPGDLVDQYLAYTYPYDIFGRIADIRQEAAQRRLDGLIHYTQSFCFRQIQDLLLRRHLELPILTLEGDRPTPVDHRTRMRLEAFIDVLRP